MKNIFKIIMGFSILALSAESCHKLDVPVNSQLTPDVFPTTLAQFNAVMGPIYTRLRSDYSIGFFQVVSHSTDESVQPAYGGNWFDGGRFMQMHYHTWDKDNPLLNGVWNYFSDMVGIANQTMFILSTAPDGAAKNQALAEMRTMRAFSYFQMMDLFGNIPLDTVYGNRELKTNTPRAQVFTFLESELRNAIPFLSPVAGSTMYGKPNRYTAYAILAKLYLNAQVYTGTARLNEAVVACDSIMNAGGGTLYRFEPRATYLQMFYPNNGPQQREFIFSIPYDASTSNGFMFHARYDLNRNQGIRFLYSGSTPGTNVNPVINQTTGNGLVNVRPSGPRMTLPEYLAYFNDPGDVRNGQWLSGKQYWQDGSPIMVSTTKRGFDQFYTGSDGGAPFVYHLELSPSFSLRQNVNTFDCGNDEIAWNMGTRNIKFFPDATNRSNRNQNNDVPIFRYSDIVLTKAEAILRGAAPTQGHTALSLVNSLRASRTTSTPWTTVNLDSIYAERARELSWECWRRNDMIRFGKFEDSWGLKTDRNVNKRIFPIPNVAFQTNPKLVQNPGY